MYHCNWKGWKIDFVHKLIGFCKKYIFNINHWDTWTHGLFDVWVATRYVWKITLFQVHIGIGSSTYPSPCSNGVFVVGFCDVIRLLFYRLGQWKFYKHWDWGMCANVDQCFEGDQSEPVSGLFVCPCVGLGCVRIDRKCWPGPRILSNVIGK